MSKGTVNIIGIPLDLGANMRGANIGPAAVRIAGLHRKIRNLDFEIVDSGDLPVPVREEINEKDAENKYLKQITSACNSLSRHVADALNADQFSLVIGGDHSIAVGSVGGVLEHAAQNNQKVGIVWIDAHADLNTPKSSPSGNIHGMPLSAILGDGHPDLVKIANAHGLISPEAVALIGIRNIDGKEKELVKESGVHYYTMRQIDEQGMYRVMKEAISNLLKHCDIIHLSFDLDGVDPLFAPGVSTPVSGGISYREAHLALEMIADTKRLRSAEFVEINPIQDQAHKTASLTIELVQSALGKSIV